MPKVSIIIPVYNAEKYLEKCLDSVFNQTFEDFEVICVNDGSTDNSLEILNYYKRNYPNLTIINQTNQGLSITRNEALKYFTGEYVFFLDADDTIHPQCIDILYHFATHNNAELVCSHLSLDQTTNSCNINIPTTKSKMFANPLFESARKDQFRIGFQACAKLYRKSLLKNIKFIPKIHFEDFPFLYAILSKRPSTVVIDAKLYFYTIDPLSISHRKTHPKQIKDYFTGIKYIFDTYSATHLEKERLYLIDYFIPRILSHQFGRCRHAEKHLQPQMYDALRDELQWLVNNNYINWNKLSIIRRIQYYFILKSYLWYK